MGCCHSTVRSNSSSTPYLPHQNPAESSSRAIAQDHRTSSAATSPRTSSHTPTLNQPRSSRRHLPAHEHFNAPVRLHKPSPSSSSRHPPKRWTPFQLRKERQEFFETRVTGREEVWGSLRLVCEALWEGDVATAQGILDAVGVTVPTGDLVEGCYDEQGGLYVLPGWVVGEPDGVVEVGEGEEDGEDKRDYPGSQGDKEVGRGEKGKEALDVGVGTEGMVKVRARLSDRGGDVVVLMGREEKVGSLARRVVQDAKLPVEAKIKIAYLGRILEGKETLQAQGWREGHVVNALVFQ